ncbi:ABC transporter [Neobacillus cucumis]|uniref:ABC transporter n=1 Tax=Neobacillus cucumis TaxID=1740721 RepID=UPI0019639750|nr:ABC transporter [Neobacillus cucumis]MBM7651060.1 amino acid transporter [Neobacillus cucumis]
MGHNHSSCGIFGVFLGFLTGVIWLVFVALGWVTILLGAIGLTGFLVTVINFLIALIGFLAFLIFGLCVFKKAWHLCKHHC